MTTPQQLRNIKWIIEASKKWNRQPAFFNAETMRFYTGRDSVAWFMLMFHDRTYDHHDLYNWHGEIIDFIFKNKYGQECMKDWFGVDFCHFVETHNSNHYINIFNNFLSWNDEHAIPSAKSLQDAISKKLDTLYATIKSDFVKHLHECITDVENIGLFHTIIKYVTINDTYMHDMITDRLSRDFLTYGYSGFRVNCILQSGTTDSYYIQINYKLKD